MADFDLSMAITADGDQAVSELNQVKAAQDNLNRGNEESSRSSRKAAGSAADLARAQRETSKAINEVTRATNPAVGSQRALDAALRRAESAFVSGKISAEAYARAQRIASQATFAAGNSARSASTGTAQLGMQINDLGTQVSMGTNPMNALAMQLGQVGFAMSQMNGKARTVGMFLAGPWGAALSIASVALGALVAKLFESKDATEDLAATHQYHKMTLEQLVDAINEQNEALGKAARSGREAEIQAVRNAEAARQEVIRTREVTVALLEQARARFKAAQGVSFGAGGGAGAGGAVSFYARQIGSLESDLATAQGALAKATQNVRLAQLPLVERGSRARTDPSAAIAERYQEKLDALNASFLNGTKTLAQVRTETDRLNDSRKREEKALQDSNRTQRAGGQPSLPKVTPGEFGSILKSLFGGGSVNSTVRSVARNREVGGDPNSYHLANSRAGAVDFTPRGGMGVVPANWKELVTAAAGAAGIKVLELLGPGDKGHSDHLHGAFAKARLGPDQVASAQAAADRAREARDQRADALADWGAQAGNRLGDMAGRFGEGGGALGAMNAALADLNLLLAEIEERKPPNLKELLQQGAAAKGVIEDSVNRPWREFIADQERSFEIQRLINGGHEDQAEVLQIIAGLEEDIGRKLLPEQAAAVRAIVAARRAEQREAEEARAKQEKYLDAIKSTRDAFRSIFTFSGEGLRDLPKRLAATFEKLLGDYLFESLFGKFFKELEDQVKGTTIVQDASTDMAAAIASANAAIDTLGKAAQRAADNLNGVPPAEGETPDGGEIVVTGRRKPRDPTPQNPAQFIEILLNKISPRLGKLIGEAMQGAGTGIMAANSILGERSKTGNAAAAIGGAIGGMAGKAIGASLGGPAGAAIGQMIGSAAGGVLGGLVGGKKKLPSGGAVITNAFDPAEYGGSGRLQKGIGALAQSVQDGLREIASTLGGSPTGGFNVSVGQYDGDWRVNTSGLTGRSLRAGTPGTFDFNDDQGAAIAFAVADAIKDGAIRGLSTAVQKALASSDDIQRALREALAVRDLELLIGGLGSQLQKAFLDFEVQAKERVRLAKTYGLDLVKLEEINAKERADVFKRVMDDRIGALREFLSELTYGNLFEGTPAEQRQALLGEIGTTRAAAERGDEGAAGRLADLERRLVELSRDAYGTAGPEYAADRAMAKSDAERIIALETQRAREAQERAIASLNAATTQNQLQNETNNLLSEILVAVRNGSTGTGSASGVGGGSATFGSAYDTSRLVNLL